MSTQCSVERRTVAGACRATYAAAVPVGLLASLDVDAVRSGSARGDRSDDRPIQLVQE